MAKHEVLKEFKASLMISGAKIYHHKILQEDLDNDYTKDIDK